MGDMALLQQAIIQFTMNALTNQDTVAEIAEGADWDISTRPFVPVLPPLMIRTEPYDQMDRLDGRRSLQDRR